VFLNSMQRNVQKRKTNKLREKRHVLVARVAGSKIDAEGDTPLPPSPHSLPSLTTPDMEFPQGAPKFFFESDVYLADGH
jgi:hypothetical protein